MADKNVTTPLSLHQVAEMLERAIHALKEIRHLQSAEEVRDMAEDELLQDPVLKVAFQRGQASRTTVASAMVDPNLPTRQVSTSPPITMAPTAAIVTGFKRRPRSRPINTTPMASTLVSLQRQVNVFPPFSNRSKTDRSHTLRRKSYSLAITAASDHSSLPRSNADNLASLEPMSFMTETKVKDKTKNNNKREKSKKIMGNMTAMKAETTGQLHRRLKHPNLSPKIKTTSTLASSSTSLVSDQSSLDVLATPKNPTNPVEELIKDVDNIYLQTPYLSLPEEPKIEEEEDQPFFKDSPPSSPKSR